MAELKLASIINTRPLTQEDAALIKAWANQPGMVEYFRRFPPTHLWPANFLSWFENTYIVRIDDQDVGMVMLSSYDGRNRSAELGILIDESVSNRGQVAAQAAILMGDYGFNYLGLERIWCHILPHRTSLRTLLESYGFKCEGVARNSIFHNGNFSDQLVMSILKSEFMEIK